MARISRRSRNNTENKRYGHKEARAKTRQALEQDRVVGPVRGMHWSSSVEQAPLPDASVGPPRQKKGGCKRNKYGPHVIESWPSTPTTEHRFDPELGRWVFAPVPYWRRSWHPPYRCANCGKGFYKIPNRNAVMKPTGTTIYLPSNRENEKQDEHFDLWNIRARLLGIACRCNDCKET